jgi:uncharacterized cysteine cluster protein YcgN (CxxCxxCC family)
VFRILTDDERHEAKCRRCGMSCHTPILLGTQSVIIPELRCTYLGRNEENGEYFCTVYERRHEVAPWCKTVAESIPTGALAWDCPYVWSIPGYRGKRWANRWERGLILKELRASILMGELTTADNPDAVLPILDTETEEYTYELQGDRYYFRKK